MFFFPKLYVQGIFRHIIMNILELFAHIDNFVMRILLYHYITEIMPIVMILLVNLNFSNYFFI